MTHPQGLIRPESALPWLRRTCYQVCNLSGSTSGRESTRSLNFLPRTIQAQCPVLELDDGTLIAECTAITEYIDALDGTPTLTGKTPLEKGVIHMMNKRAELELLDPVSVYFHHATPGLGPEVELYQNKEWGLRQRDKALHGMHYFDTVLRERPYVAGDSFSMADITVIAGLIFAAIVKLQVPEECEALRAWYKRMQQRPA